MENIVLQLENVIEEADFIKGPIKCKTLKWSITTRSFFPR
jgi:hypothetical protein